MVLKVRDSGLSMGQDMMLPCSPGDWLPPDHLSYFIVDVVAALDLSGFTQGRRQDGRGGAFYDPKAMVGLLLYGYMTGVMSSRKIEAKTFEDLGFIVAGLGCHPDHTSLCRFRASHDQAFRSVFTQVVRICCQAGLVDMSMVAVDGTKMKANASINASRTAEQLVGLLVDEAEVVDAAEDEADRSRPPALPTDPRLSRRGRERQARIRQALADLESDKAAAETAQDRKRQAQQARLAAGQSPGRPVSDTVTKNHQPRSRANTTDPDSRIMKTRTGFMQAYNAQVVAVASQVVVAADVFTDPADTNLLAPMISQAIGVYALAAGQAPPEGFDCLADAGYYSTGNAALEGVTTWIPTGSRRTTGKKTDTKRAENLRRAEVIARYGQGLVTARQAALDLGITTSWFSTLARRHRTQEPSTIDLLDARMATPDGRTRYKQRSQTVEPVFGQIKHNRGIRSLPRRGLDAARTDFLLITTGSNLLKAYKAR